MAAAKERSSPSTILGGSSSRRSGRFSGRLSGRAKKGAESPKKLNLDAAANAQTSPETQSPTSSDNNPWEEVADDEGNSYFYNSATGETAWGAEKSQVRVYAADGERWLGEMEC